MPLTWKLCHSKQISVTPTSVDIFFFLLEDIEQLLKLSATRVKEEVFEMERCLSLYFFWWNLVREKRSEKTPVLLLLLEMLKGVMGRDRGQCSERGHPKEQSLLCSSCCFGEASATLP